VRYALRQRDGLARLGHSAVRVAAETGRGADRDRSEHDALPDVAGRLGRPGDVRVRTCQQGDIFVQKAPASTVADLAHALRQMFKADSAIKIIGTRHGEKLYESLISREEMAHANDMGDYYRIPADNRDLNYAKFFTEGEREIASLDDYTSHNTRRLNVEQVAQLLLKLDYIKEEINA